MRIETKVDELRKERRTNRTLVKRVSEKVITELYSTILRKEEEQLENLMTTAKWMLAKIDGGRAGTSAM